MSKLAADQIEVGAQLAGGGRLLVSRRPLGRITLRVPIFGWHVSLTGDEEETGRFGAEASSGNLARAWDFDLPQSSDKPLWAGYARRAVNAYVPKWNELSNDWERKKYSDRLLAEDPPEQDKTKTLNHLACSGRYLDDKGRPVGIEAIATLKGDVDNLGLLFQQGLRNPIAAVRELARQAHEQRALGADAARALLYTVGLVGRENERIEAMFAQAGVSRKELDRVRRGLQGPMGCQKRRARFPTLCAGCVCPAPPDGGYASPALFALRERPQQRRVPPPWPEPAEMAADPGDTSIIEVAQRLSRLEAELRDLETRLGEACSSAPIHEDDHDR